MEEVPSARLALCTSAKRGTVKELIDGEPSGVGSSAFGLRVTQEDVAQTEMKPHPRPYLLAADMVDLPVERCIALEDSVTGVASARGAGYGHVLGITSSVNLVSGVYDANELQEASRMLIGAGATRVFKSTAHAIEWILRSVADGKDVTSF